MLPDPFLAPVESNQPAAPKSFSLLSLGPNSSLRENLSATAGEPRVMKTANTIVGKGKAARKRSRVGFESFPVVDGVEDRSGQPAAVYAVLDVPVSGFTDIQIHQLCNYLTGTLRGAGGTVDGAQQASNSNYFAHRWHQGEV